MASSQKDKLSREKLVLGLERASKGLQKKLAESFEAAMIPAIADELLRVQDTHDVELKTADIASLRKDLGVDQDKDSLLGIALSVLELLQTNGRARKDPSPSCDTEGNAASCAEEKADSSETRTVSAKPAPVEKVEYSEDATYGFVVIQGDHHTLALGTLASFEVKFDKTFGVANKHGKGGQSQKRFARLAEESR